MNPDNCSTERTKLALDRPDLLRETLHVAGVWRTGGGDAFTVVNPASGAVIGHIAGASDRDVLDAIESASAALPAWRRRTAADRAALLHRLAALVRDNSRDLARILTAEQGKPLSEANGEIASTAAHLDWAAEEGLRAYGETIPTPRPDARILTIMEPVGVVAAITPWNFPSAMIARKLAPALAAGCTLVIKPSEETPYSALALAALCDEAGIPAGVVNLVCGDPARIGELLTAHGDVRKLSFTGSTRVGKLLTAACADTMKRVSMELGGNAPFIVFDDADIDAAVEGLIVAKFRNSGQTCVCANRVFVHADIHDRFATALAARADAISLGDGLLDNFDQGPLINGAAIAKVDRLVSDAIARGAHRLAGADRGEDNLYRPTVLTGVTAEMAVTREEIFGPVAALIRFDDEEAVIRAANATDAGLAAYVYTRDIARLWRLSEALEYGMVGINIGMLSSEVSPFGGVKQSGLGREGSKHGLSDYLEIKSITIGGL